MQDYVVPGDGAEMLHQFEIDSVSLRITLHYNSIDFLGLPINDTSQYQGQVAA